jgi:hypothetical protein
MLQETDDIQRSLPLESSSAQQQTDPSLEAALVQLDSYLASAHKALAAAQRQSDPASRPGLQLLGLRATL